MSAARDALALGEHVLGDLSGIAPARLRDVAALETVLRDAATAAGATILGAHMHRFGEGGVTGVLLLAESHLSIHTWPEHGFAAIDVFMCGDARPFEAAQAIAAGLGATHARYTRATRHVNAD